MTCEKLFTKSFIRGRARTLYTYTRLQQQTTTTASLQFTLYLLDFIHPMCASNWINYNCSFCSFLWRSFAIQTVLSATIIARSAHLYYVNEFSSCECLLLERRCSFFCLSACDKLNKSQFREPIDFYSFRNREIVHKIWLKFVDQRDQ